MSKKKCSFVPDHSSGIHNCCDVHDKRYSSGIMKRVTADRKFRECITTTSHPVIAWIYWVGVRLFGWIFYRKGK